MEEKNIKKLTKLFKKDKIKNGHKFTKRGESTLKTHIKRVNVLFQSMGFEDQKDFKAFDEVLNVQKIIEEKKANSTKIAYFDSVITVLKLTKNKNVNIYRGLRQSFINQRTLKELDQELTPSQQAKYVDISEIIKVRKKLKEISKNGNFHDHQKYLVIALYTLLPPVRLEYGDMSLYLEPIEDKKNNYIQVYDKKIKIVLNNFKTVDKMGQIIFKNEDVKGALKIAINKWVRLRKKNKITSKSFLVKKNKTGVTRNWLTGYVKSIFKKHLKKNITPSLLRTIYVTNLFKPCISLKKHKRIARQMGHSVDISHKAYRKIL